MEYNVFRMNSRANNPPSNSESPPVNEEEQKLAFWEDLSAQDLAQTDIIAQLFGMFILYKAEGYTRVNNIFNTLNNPHLSKSLLDFNNPENYQAIRASLKAANQRFEKTKSKKLEKRFLWLHNTLTYDRYNRVVYATAVAKRVHRAVNSRTNDLKIQNQLQRLGLFGEEATKFKTRINTWLKDHPGQSLDEAIIVETSRVFRERNVKFGKKEKKALAVQLENDRKTALEQIQPMIKRAESVINSLQNPTNPLPSISDLHKEIFYVETGQVIIDVTPPPKTELDLLRERQKEILDRGFKKTAEDLVELRSIEGKIRSLQTPSPSQPTLSTLTPITTTPAPSSQRLTVSRFNLDNLFSKIFPRLSSIAGKTSRALTSIGQRLINRGLQFTLKGLGKIGGKVLGQLISSIIPGIGNLLVGIAQVLGLDELALKAALFAVGVVVALFILIILGLSGGSYLFSPYTPYNPLVIPVLTPTPSNVSQSWQEFEKENLLVWETFEKENLLPQQTYLTESK